MRFLLKRLVNDLLNAVEEKTSGVENCLNSQVEGGHGSWDRSSMLEQISESREHKYFNQIS